MPPSHSRPANKSRRRYTTQRRDAVRKWIFKPYLVLDKPVEVEQNVEFSNN
jgi:hypothetical protein